MVRGTERRNSPKQRRHIPRLTLLFSFPACHGAPSTQESTRQTHTHIIIHECQCSPGKHNAFWLLPVLSKSNKKQTKSAVYMTKYSLHRGALQRQTYTPPHYSALSFPVDVNATALAGNARKVNSIKAFKHEGYTMWCSRRNKTFAKTVSTDRNEKEVVYSALPNNNKSSEKKSVKHQNISVRKREKKVELL